MMANGSWPVGQLAPARVAGEDLVAAHVGDEPPVALAQQFEGFDRRDHGRSHGVSTT